MLCIKKQKQLKKCNNHVIIKGGIIKHAAYFCAAKNYMKYISTILFLLVAEIAVAQDSLNAVQKKYSIHAQATLIPQYHFNFNAPYTGVNSLLPTEPVATSFTSTLFVAYKAFKNTYIVFNPEASGGKALSHTLGVAGFPNGETYRVGDPAVHPFIARLYVEQQFPLSNRTETVEDDINQIKETRHKDYISVLAGKFSTADFFDASEISNDPRTQFLNWSLMGSGAWDYPANTRGYTMGAVVQFIYHDYHVRTALTTVPIEANGPDLQFKWGKAMGSVIEFGKKKLFKMSEHVYTDASLGFFLNKANMGNYNLAIKQALPVFMQPDITTTREYGREKKGCYISIDNHFNKIQHYINYSRNDGQNETWAFTEIDRSFATGLHFDGDLWKRKNDHLGIAFVANGLSDAHKNYLAAGGYGFIIGDGKLNYGLEQIIELYYSWNITGKLFISPDYQFINHPAYNKDRGPVHVIAVRLHLDL
jgi:high affinity Mn2+ porin